MKFVQFQQFGGPEVLSLERGDPAPVGAGEVRVRVRAAGVNYADTLQRRGVYPLSRPFPVRPGGEVVGDVVEIGPGTSLQVGDRVAAMIDEGGYADEVVVDGSRVLPCAADLDPAAVTALLVQGMTAVGLEESVDSPRPSRVFVTAGAGGVGSLLVQRLSRRGHEVLAGVSSEHKAAHVRALGAVPIRYDQPGWADTLGDTELGVVFDAVGGDIARTLQAHLAPLGTFVSYGAASGVLPGLSPEANARAIFGNHRFIGFALPTWLSTQPDRLGRAWETLLEEVRTGGLVVPIGARFPLTRAPDAHALLESRGSIGKVVLIPEEAA